MAGLWSKQQGIQILAWIPAWILVLSFLTHHCLASSMQQQPPVVEPQASATQHNAAAAAAAEDAMPSLRNILRRSVGGTMDSAADTSHLSHNGTKVLPAALKTSHTQDSTESLRTESSSAKEELIKTNPLNVEEEKHIIPERTDLVAPSENIPCPECQRQRKLSQLDPETLRQIRIETIKREILSKLKFEKPPNVTRNEMNIPAPLSEGQFGGTDVDMEYSGENEVGDNYRYYGKTTQVIITAKDDLVYCPTKSTHARCFEFDLSKAAGMHVLSAELWFHKIDTPSTENTEYNQTIVVSQLASRHSRIKKELLRETVSLNGTGWLTFDMKHKVQNFINHSQRQQRLEIHCEDCGNDFSISSKSGYKPFLSVSTSEPNPRKPREIVCGETTTDCCRERFYVSFAEIGWDTWILQPKGYYANYCKGSCAGPVIPKYAHTSVLHTVIAHDDPDDPMREFLAPCCSPKVTKSLQLLYFGDDNNTIYRRLLADMAIESCACS